MAGTLSAAAGALAGSDPAMAALVERLGPLSLDDRAARAEDPFAALARIITGQQVSTAAARTIWGRVCDRFGGGPPTAAAAADAQDRLRECGLSGRKASYVAGLAQAIVSGELDPAGLTEAGDEEVIAELTRIRGIGRWSGEMFLIFHLRRPDVFSGGDLGLRNGLRISHGLEQVPTPQQAAEIAERWRPHRTLAALYLWAAVAVGEPA